MLREQLAELGHPNAGYCKVLEKCFCKYPKAHESPECPHGDTIQVNPQTDKVTTVDNRRFRIIRCPNIVMRY